MMANWSSSSGVQSAEAPLSQTPTMSWFMVGRIGQKPDDFVFVFHPFGDPAENLRGDDAGVASSAHQKAFGEGAGDRRAGFIVLILDFLGPRGEGEVHVHARIPIWDGENVQLIDFGVMVIKIVRSGEEELFELLTVDAFHFELFDFLNILNENVDLLEWNLEGLLEDISFFLLEFRDDFGDLD